ncbi:MAG: sigma 54-interacting transcriptional regulator [Alphaproteobacteria bacterium]
MIKIRVFVPHLELEKVIDDAIANLPKVENIDIETTYVFGTPDILSQNWDADILVARGMTHDVLKEYFPHKHIIKIQFNSFDIFRALVECKKKKAKKIALCLHNIELGYIPELEAFCDASIKVFDVCDEYTARKAIEQGIAEGFDVFVGAGTVCGICDDKNLERIHIHTSYKSVELALLEAIGTAKVMNVERTRSNIISTMYNNSIEAIIAIDSKGNILEINNQAHRIFQLTTVGNLKGRSALDISSSKGWQEIVKGKIEQEKIVLIHDKNYYVQYKFLSYEDTVTGAVIFIKNTDQIIEEEIKIRRNLSKKGLTAKYSFGSILGKSKAILENKEMAERFSQVNSNVLITGETGTGKELFAHSIHMASNRRNSPFVAVNCAALPENLLESELFGYEDGAFSGAAKGGKAGLFELAHKGTIFLDEIGEIPIALQAKLLRVLQEHEIRRIGSTTVQPVDVRIISATNINMDEKIETGEFRLDLYYRLNTLDVIISPLRERKEDIQGLIDLFLSEFACAMGKSIPVVTPDAAKILMEHDWLGNVRELKNICERLIVLNDSNIINTALLNKIKIFSQKFEQASPTPNVIATDSSQYKLKPKKKDLAKELGVSRTTLWRMEKQHKDNI